MNCFFTLFLLRPARGAGGNSSRLPTVRQSAIPMLPLHVVVNCGPCEPYIHKCLHSLRTQSYRHWNAFVTVDPAGDRTYERALDAAASDPRISVVGNRTRQFSMHNLVEAIRRSHAAADDVIVCLDGDDWFATDKALAVIAATYARFDCWLTYGSFVTDRPDARGRVGGRWPAYPPGTTAFRHARWLATAVRSWKKWLWDLVDDRDLRDDDGHYFRVTEDQAVMLPMLEMSGTDRAQHIPMPLVVYNRSNPYNSGKWMLAEMARNGDILTRRPQYPRLPARPPAPRPAAAAPISGNP
jgi:glycosyltransferase involved in cell wall biosynthesis